MEMLNMPDFDPVVTSDTQAYNRLDFSLHAHRTQNINVGQLADLLRHIGLRTK